MFHLCFFSGINSVVIILVNVINVHPFQLVRNLQFHFLKKRVLGKSVNILTRIAKCYKKVRHNKCSHSFILQPQYKYNQQLATFTCTFIPVILWCELSTKVSF